MQRQHEYIPKIISKEEKTALSGFELATLCILGTDSYKLS